MLFFLVGPLRTGSSLLSRCIDDHPQAICLCESEINRALFAPFLLKLHVQRMLAHGFETSAILDLLDRKVQSNTDSFLRWHVDALRRLQPLYGKPQVFAFGDKSPDYFFAAPLVDLIATKARALYTVRNPKAILRSIYRQDTSDREKSERWSFFKRNIAAWRPHWDRPNLLASRYEDLVTAPEETMARVYTFLGLEPSRRFLEDFPRLHPRRFMWETAIDTRGGSARAFDPARAAISDEELSDEQLSWIYDDRAIVGFMERFGYG